MIWPLIVLTLLVTSLLATLIPCVWAVFSRKATALWVLLLAAYLCVAGIVATELFCHLNRVFRDPNVNMDYSEIRGWMYQVYAGFALSFVLGLLILRLMGMQLIGGRMAADKRGAVPDSGRL